MKKVIEDQDRLNQVIGRNIKFYREMYNLSHKDKMTQARLAKLVGVSTPLIGSLESENTLQGVSTFNLYKISQVLNVPIEKFYETPVMEKLVDNYEKAK